MIPCPDEVKVQLMSSALLPLLEQYVAPPAMRVAFFVTLLAMAIVLVTTVRLHMQNHPLAVWLWGAIVLGVVSVTLRAPYVLG